MKHAGPLEVEVKLSIPSTAAVRPQLQAAGFTEIHPAALERSELWDRDGHLRAQDCALRLRRYGGSAALTWKGPRLADPALKIRPELETAVADPEAMAGILKALGFEPVLVMEKTRSVWSRIDLEACLDDTPFGSYLELEGEREGIEAAMAELGLGLERVETRSYATLYGG
jgi:adenylate cyclase class 2